MAPINDTIFRGVDSVIGALNPHVSMVVVMNTFSVATPLWPSVRMKHTLPKLVTWSPSGLPNL